jgi:hypothetical protein
MVERISATRTTDRSSMSCSSASGRKPARRVHSPTYAARGDCDWMPTRCSTASSGEIRRRRRRSCLARSARLSRSVESTGGLGIGTKGY